MSKKAVPKKSYKELEFVNHSKLSKDAHEDDMELIEEEKLLGSADEDEKHGESSNANLSELFSQQSSGYNILQMFSVLICFRFALGTLHLTAG